MGGYYITPQIDENPIESPKTNNETSIDIRILLENGLGPSITFLRLIDMYTIEIIGYGSWTQNNEYRVPYITDEFELVDDFLTRGSFRLPGIIRNNVYTGELIEISSEQSQKLKELVNNVKQTEANIAYTPRLFLENTALAYAIIDGDFFWSWYVRDIKEWDFPRTGKCDILKHEVKSWKTSIYTVQKFQKRNFDK